MRNAKAPPKHKDLPVDVSGRLLTDIERYAKERGMTEAEAATDLMNFALKARFKTPKKPAGRVLRLPR